MSATNDNSPKRTYAAVATPPPSPRASDMAELTIDEKEKMTTEMEAFPPLPSSASKASPLCK